LADGGFGRSLTGVMSVSGLELASVIRQLRAELNEALDDAEGERLRFELGPVEMSLTVTVGREATPGAKIRFWVVEAGADARMSRESVQDIKLVLTPRDTKAPLGSDGKAAAPLIKGDALDGED
jgi:Trypsin-co-occurring domain 2